MVKIKHFLRRLLNKLSLQNTIILIVFFATLVSLVVSSLLTQNYVIKKEYERSKDKMAAIAEIFALNADIKEALLTPNNDNDVQQLSLEVAKKTQMDFIVVLDNDLIRLSHPDASEIGKPFSDLEDARQALSGNSHFSERKGVLGDGLRFFTPVLDDNGQIIGIICAGLTLQTIQSEVRELQQEITLGILLGLIVGIMGAIIIGKTVKNMMYGLEPNEIATILEEKNLVQDEINEGILAIDASRKVILINQATSNLFSKALVTDGYTLGETLHPSLFNLFFKHSFDTKAKQQDSEIFLNHISLVANTSPTFIHGIFHGSVTTFRDQSEMRQLIRTLSGTEQYIHALRAQTHEFMNKLHVIMGLIHQERYAEVSDYINELTIGYNQEVGFLTDKIKTPAIAGFLMGKINEASEQDCLITLEQASYLPELTNNEHIHQVLQILGNLLDNALDAVLCATTKEINVLLQYDQEGHILIIEVSDSGSGIDDKVLSAIFERGFSTKGEHRGYGLHLIQRLVNEKNGLIDVTTSPTSGTTFYIELPITN